MNKHFNYFFEAYKTFENKLLNRKYETQQLDKYYRQLPQTINVLSFPHEYAYETNIIKKYGKNMNIFSAEKLGAKDPGTTISYAQSFLKKYKNKANVFIPAKQKGNIVTTIHPAKINVLDILYGDIQFTKVNLTNVGIDSTLYNPPKKYDLIDLDYVGMFDPYKQNVNGLAYNSLRRGGLLLITYGITAARAVDKTLQQYMDVFDDEQLKQYSYTALQQSSAGKINIPYKQMLKYGAEERNVNYNNILNNIVRLSNLGTPIFANIYKGGVGAKGTTMARLVYRKTR